MAAFRPSVALTTCLLATVLSSPFAAAQWTAVSLHVPGAFASEGRAVGDGQQVGYHTFTASDFHATLWAGSALGYVDLTPPGATFSDTRDVGNSQQVGLAKFGGLEHAMLWTGDPLTAIDLTPPGATRATAYAIDGDVQSGQAKISFEQAGLWHGSAATWESLHPAPPYNSSGVIAAQGGHQVGFAAVNSGVSAALWSGTKASFVNLAPAGVVGISRALGVWGDEQVGYVEYAFKSHAALWSGSAASYVDLHPPTKTYSTATAVDHGIQVGYVSPGIHAALWHGTAESFENLHDYLPAGYKSSTASGIWRDDATGVTYVIGTATNSTTNGSEAMLWMSEPASAWSDQGSALAGVSGDPVLTGSGTLALNAPNDVDLGNAAPTALAGLFIALSSTPTPFKGGTLLASPPVIGVQVTVTDGSGAIPLSFVTPPGGVSGMEIWVQWAIQDGAASHGVALSNALKGVAP